MSDSASQSNTLPVPTMIDDTPATGLALNMPASFPGAAKHLAHRLAQLVAKCRPGYCVSKGVRDQIEECQAVALATVFAIENQPAPVIDYKPGEWFQAATVEDLQRFYLSRLPAIREAAQGQGYAIGLHGSMRRDLDLIAVPWRDGAAEPDTLAHAVAHAACGITRQGRYEWESKPAGRIATSLPICWPGWHGQAGAGHIDLSVMPAVSCT